MIDAKLPGGLCSQDAEAENKEDTLLLRVSQQY